MKINKYIDSTLLKPEATKEDVIEFCKEAIENDFAAVCLHVSRIKLAKEMLKNSNIEISGTVGFPFGNTSVEVKILEAKESIKMGATEIDFVINIGYVKDHNWELVLNELKEIKKAIPNNIVKVILENCLLTNEEIVKCCKLACEAKIDYVKTSTGYS
ncbi:deoxyribose-phosphate aldolase [Spiroplasma tabanidicola]|uniref:Deoxyribose-phosphate aldolase n=1 Tax=Spiroplasma tabanidicola TaxID=324079 RepID=A0A6I6C479_9MOLU|nr:deoxyribose-phosphate aldolase [Spiroplasma tabanidicola]QGS51627.1 deoxyribose-phosphate aldolase [Spiroplasma tabanidicola]